MVNILGGIVLLLLGILCLFFCFEWIFQFLVAIITILLIAGGVIAIISGIKANKEQKNQVKEQDPKDDVEEKSEESTEE